MSTPEPRARTLSAMVGISLVVVFFVLAGIVTTLLRYQDRAREAREAAEMALAREAQSWDKRVIELAEQRLALLRGAQAPGEIASLEARLREQERWFDAYYLWRPAPEGRGAPDILYPPQPLAEDLPTLNRAPCVLAAYEQVGEAQAEALLSCGADPSPAVRLFAIVSAGHLLLQSGQAARALGVLGSLPVPHELAEAAREGFPQNRVVLRELLLVDVLVALDRPEEAIQHLIEVGDGIAGANGPILEESLGALRWTVLPRLSELGAETQAQRLTQALPVAERRLAAWQEVKGRLSHAAIGPELKLVHDRYSDDPYLLAYAELEEGGARAAVQMHQSALLETLLASSEASLVVTDEAGQHLAGPREAPIEVAPFTRALTHLRLGATEAQLQAAEDANRTQTLREASGFMIMSVLGIWALFALKSASDKEQALLERQREFVTRVTHELKTPLAGIRVMAETLQIVGAQDPERVANFSERIIGEADKLTQRIDEILSVARASKPAEPSPYDISELLGELVEEWEPRMAVAGVDLDAEIESVPDLRGDVALVRDALVCLLDNALKYRDPEREEPRVEVRCALRGPEVVVEVTDNGIGVPANKRAVIFERFTRVEEPGREKAGGHGLGLAFVREAVDSQRGRVECREGIDGGARFVVRLPLPG
ncbi:MAG: HAMP domain-containing histidine kinase [Alphaproteobacteria bacterium]|nr:HAMP domain-containing histidine kinase [Alphaproteobacteria bacterium]